MKLERQVIGIRASRDVKGRHLNEYVPFYLAPRSPMLYVIQHGYNGVARVEAATAKQRLIDSGIAPEKIVAVPGYYF